MKLSELIKKLQDVQKGHDDLDVCLAVSAWDNFVLLQNDDIAVCEDIYALNIEQEIAEGYENGKKAVIIGTL